MSSSRRDFLKVAGITTAGALLPSAAESTGKTQKDIKDIPRYELGLTSYTFRAFSLDQAIEMTVRLGLKKISLKDMHLPLKSSAQTIERAHQKIHEAGLELSACGVIYMKTPEEVEHAFRYANSVGLKMFVGVPDETLLVTTERKAKEYDIAIAIHNHGPTDQRYPSPESAYKLIAGMDKRMGLCIDVGHIRRLGLEPAFECERFFDRLLDIHLKDVSSADAAGTTVEIGRGVIDIQSILTTLTRLGYSGTLHFEHEKDEKDPLPGVAESVGYVRGMLKVLYPNRK